MSLLRNPLQFSFVTTVTSSHYRFPICQMFTHLPKSVSR